MIHISPISLREANEFVRLHHRHHGPVPGTKFALAIRDDSRLLRGVALVGRPVARLADDGMTLEVNRCCTDGVPNGCSMLYGAAWRVARAMGYMRLITYTLEAESGASLRASGWIQTGRHEDKPWSRRSRPRKLVPSTGPKLRWEKSVQGYAANPGIQG